MKSAGEMYLQQLLKTREKKMDEKRKSTQRIEQKISVLQKKYRETKDESFNDEAKVLLNIIERKSK